MFKNKKILFLSPHTDDTELYCGGTMIKLKEQGCIIKNVAFSYCKESVPNGYPDDILKIECIQAMRMAGIDFEIKECPVRRFNEIRQNILEYMVVLNKEFKPDIIFFPSLNDIHQDHQVIHNEAMRAFKDCCLITYEVQMNSLEHSFNLIIELDQKHIFSKQEIISCYKSQAFRHYSNPEYIFTIAKMAGSFIKKPYAETFKIIRWKD